MTHTRRRYYRTGRKTLRDGKGHGWNWSTPSWWNRLFNNRPNRQAMQRALHAFTRNPELADGIVYPLDRKPHKYFW